MRTYLIPIIVVLFFYSCKKDAIPAKITEVIKPIEIFEYGFKLNDFEVINDTIKTGESFGVIMDRHHVLYPKINKIASSIKDTFDVRRVRSGKPYTILASKDSLTKAQVFIYKHNKIDATIINFKDSTINAYTYKKPIQVVEKKIMGVVNSSFSVTMDSLGLRGNLTNEVADIYAWTLDFFKLQKGDTFKIIYEEKFINDTTFAGYGKIKAAVFNHKGKDLYAYRYVADSIKKIPEYFDDEAGLLRRQFLKSPIKFQYRISSRYNLKRRIAHYGYRVRPHKGTDFAAPSNTPIMATANGTVIESRRSGGKGNYVTVKHNSTYTTKYFHMRRRKAKVGDFVKQGDIIGYVGTTGSSSGNHVCYRFWKNGREVDPFKQKLPSAKPMDEAIKPDYFEYIKPLKDKLDTISLEENNQENLIEEENLIANN
ncbi:peptidoglycan DD-metalloendopeptidase family protein [Tenacibaculum sp. 1_MG-2023]|uniref:peptidoglycan DD-metalloendopeptidase family protein n=1 Tax=Tenacibaculum sp. 1_MG-2023 TaxID=3062653 RepID=UPI0026E17DD9|nr:peptidoglycan DD-metalloendopeptidase family protein [Tenacibaculum sp. 1_MG-2023]MDO6599209.1 peptidoglycan DD-metalloendopeptidase family protein [Tenacibaculum sp. 1_MG-2023]